MEIGFVLLIVSGSWFGIWWRCLFLCVLWRDGVVVDLLLRRMWEDLGCNGVGVSASLSCLCRCLGAISQRSDGVSTPLAFE